MEIFKELLLTVIVSLGLAFLIAKLVSVASAGNVEQRTVLIRSEKKKKKKKEIDEFDDKKVVTEERSFVGDLKSKGLKTEKRVKFVDEPLIVERVKFVEEPLIVERVKIVEESLVVDTIEGDLVIEGSAEIVHDEEEILTEEGSELVEVLKQGGVEILNKGSELELEEAREEKIDEEHDEEEVEVAEEEEVKNVGVEENPLEESRSCEEEEEIKVGKFPEDCRVEEVHEIGLELAKEEEVQIITQDEQIGVGDQNENHKEIEIGVEKSRTDCWFSDDDDDWEGIETSEIKNIFEAASTFVSSGDNNELLSKLGSDVHMQLYGLHKVATEGPCYEPQPMALMVSSRAKWHAWQRLGNMSPEVAMEQYTAVLSENVPDWMGRNPEGRSKQYKNNDSPEADVSGMKDHNSSSFPHHHPVSEDERKPADHSFGEGGDGSGPMENL